MIYDVTTKKFDCKMGLLIDNEDHSWKFRFHDSGLMRVALKWKLHQSCNVSVNTGVDVKDALNGKVKGLPIGATFELQY